jgi:hypothetical protein
VTENHARTMANVVMAAAALGAAVIVLRSPKLRRLAFQFARQYAGGPLAAWAATSVRDAWEQSADPSARMRTPRTTADRSEAMPLPSANPAS